MFHSLTASFAFLYTASQFRHLRPTTLQLVWMLLVSHLGVSVRISHAARWSSSPSSSSSLFRGHTAVSVRYPTGFYCSSRTDTAKLPGFVFASLLGNQRRNKAESLFRQGKEVGRPRDFHSSTARHETLRMSKHEPDGNNDSNSATSSRTLNDGDALFGKFVIPAASIFYRSSGQTLAFVNLRPIVPGHVLVIPQRVVAKMEDMTEAEYLDMWSTVRVIQKILTGHYDCTAFNVAVQDGRAAGQSVPHVHVHILPRREGDYERNDDIYDDLQAWAPRRELENVQKLEVPDDGERRDRTSVEMADEAAVYRKIAIEKSL